MQTGLICLIWRVDDALFYTCWILQSAWICRGHGTVLPYSARSLTLVGLYQRIDSDQSNANQISETIIGIVHNAYDILIDGDKYSEWIGALVQISRFNVFKASGKSGNICEKQKRVILMRWPIASLFPKSKICLTTFIVLVSVHIVALSWSHIMLPWLIF